MDNLALQVGQVDGVEVGQVQLTHASGGQVQGDWRAQATQPDDQRFALFEPQLAIDVDLGQQHLAAVTQQFLITQHGSRPRVMRSWPPRSVRLATSIKPCSANRARTAAA